MIRVFLAVVLILAVLVPGFRRVILIGTGIIAALILIYVATEKANESSQQAAYTTPASRVRVMGAPLVRIGIKAARADPVAPNREVSADRPRPVRPGAPPLGD